MSEHDDPLNAAEPGDPAAIPQAALRPSRGPSLFWLIPLTAAIIGAWLGWQSYTARGPEVTLTFARGDGIEAGKTMVRYKAVDIGQVITIGIAPDLHSVEVTARIKPEFVEHLTDKARFWVVRPRIGTQGVSGLSTLVSGAYIEMDPAPGEPARRFVGLETPPIVTSDAPGRSYLLRATTLGSLQPGSPITYKGIEVGELLGYELSDDGEEVSVHIFVRDPYTRLVRENSRFWLASGIDLSIGADGLDLRTPSLQEVLLGGLQFEAPPGEDAPVAADRAVFELFESYAAIAEAAFTERIRYVLYFNESVRGLTVGAPVEFRGIKLGAVERIALELGRDELKPLIPVVITLHPQRLGVSGEEKVGTAEGIVTRLIEQGLKARLQTGNLLTGQLYIDLTLAAGSKPVYVTGARNLPQIPTLPTEFGEFKNNANALLAELRRFPLDQIGIHAVNALAALERTVNDPGIGAAVRKAGDSFTAIEHLATGFEQALVPLRDDLHQALGGLRADSPLLLRMNETLHQVDAAARALRELADQIGRQPDSVIWGKEKADD